MKRWIWLGIGILISAVFLYQALEGLDLGRVWEEVKGARYAWLIPGVAVYFLAVWARTWRWHYLLRPIKPISLGALFPTVVIGYMGNNVYPFRAGEVIRAYVLKRDESVSVMAGIATVVVERIFDGLTMLIFVFVALPFAPLPNWLHQTVVWATVAFFGALAAFLALAMRPDITRRLYTGLANILPEAARKPAISLADHFMEGLTSLRSPQDMLMILISSVAIWLTETTKYWFVMHAFDFEVSFFVLMLMTAVVNLATTIPSAPGYVGTFDWPGIAVLAAFGVDEDIAGGYTLVLHAALWLPITLLGIYYLARKGLSWRDFRRAEEIVAAEKQLAPRGEG